MWLHWQKDIGKEMCPLRNFHREVLFIEEKYFLLLRQGNWIRHVCSLFLPFELIYMGIVVIGKDGVTVTI